jgi:hypothetical protein
MGSLVVKWFYLKMFLVVRMNLTLPWIYPGGSAVVPTLPPLREGLVGDLQNFKSTASFVEDIRASERDQFLGSIVGTLACDLRPCPGAATFLLSSLRRKEGRIEEPSKRREKYACG